MILPNQTTLGLLNVRIWKVTWVLHLHLVNIYKFGLAELLQKLKQISSQNSEGYFQSTLI